MFAEKERNNSKKEKKHHMPDVCRAYDVYEAYEVWKRFFREDGGRERFLPHGVRTPSTARGAVPLPRRGRSWGRGIGSWQNAGGNCNCEMRLQRWVASLQRLDAFATVGCTAVLCRGAHCAPVYPRCYNNPSRGRAKGLRGDRKAPICNRRQGRRP